MNALDISTVRPYLIRALYEWCTDNGYTPHLVVSVDASVRVPREYVKDGEIVLNVGPDATGALRLGNEDIEFKARFSGIVRDIRIPVGRVLAIFARENGQGMGFPVVEAGGEFADGSEDQRQRPDGPVVQLVTPSVVDDDGEGSEPPPEPPAAPAGARPSLRRIK
ncbi:MAG: hypothetical protein Fur0019_07570 [Tibeticola sp.]